MSNGGDLLISFLLGADVMVVVIVLIMVWMTRGLAMPEVRRDDE